MTKVEEKNNDTKIIIDDLRNQLQEAKKVGNPLEQHLKKREQELEKSKTELVLLSVCARNLFPRL